MDEVALKLITDEEFDFELACSPAAAGQDNIPGNALDPKNNLEPRHLAKLNAAGKEGVACAASSPISEAALLQIFTDAQNIASHIESCRLPASCHANQLGSEDRASDTFEHSLDVLVSPGIPGIVDDDSFELMPGLTGPVTKDDAVDGCLDDMTAILDDGCHSQTHDTAIADLRSRLDRIKSQSAIARSRNATLMGSGDACTVDKVGLSSDDHKIADGDVEGECLLTSAGMNQPSSASNHCVLDQCEHAPDVLMCQGKSNSANDNSFQPDMCAAITADEKGRQTTESDKCGKQSSVKNCNRLPPRRSVAGDAKTGKSQSFLGRTKTQSRLSMTQKSQNTPVQNRGLASMTQPVVHSSSLRLSTGRKSQNTPVHNRGPAGMAQPVAHSSSLRLLTGLKSQNAPGQNRGSVGMAQPVARSSSVRLSVSNKSQNAPAENRISNQAVVRGSSLRRIPSFRRSTKPESHTPSKVVLDVVSAPTNVETTTLSATPEQRNPPAVQQGTVTKDRTRRLECVAGPDVPTSSDKVQRTNSARGSMPVYPGTRGTPAFSSADTAQKSGAMSSRRSVGPALSARSGWRGSGTGLGKKSVGPAALPKTTAAPLKATAALSTCTTAPLKATTAPPKITGEPHKARIAPPKITLTGVPAKCAGAPRKDIGAPPRATGAPPRATGAPPTGCGLKRGATVKQKSAGPLQRPVIKKPMTKLELVKPGSLLSRAAASKSSATPAGRSGQVGQGGGPLKATLPLTAAAVHQEDVDPSSYPATVTKATGKPLGRGSGSATLMLTPVSQERCIRPKRLMHAATPPPANRLSSASSGTSLRRSASFLPTPTKCRSSTSVSSASNSRLTSSSSLNSSVFSGECNSTPVTRVLTDLNGLDLNSSPSSLKLRRPLVQHTPVNKENVAKPKAPSVWSPVQRPRARSREEEATQCTKRGAPVC